MFWITSCLESGASSRMIVPVRSSLKVAGMDICMSLKFPPFDRLLSVLCGIFVLFSWGGEFSNAQDPQPTKAAAGTQGPAKVTAQKVAVPEPLKPIDLSRFPEGWVQYSADKEIPLNQIWKVIPAQEDTDAILICTGKPHGYLRTKQEYQNFEISLEWRFPNDPKGNSGLLIHTAKEDKIWPNSIQVQLHGQSTGSMFPLGQSMSSNNLQVRDLMLTPQQWNRLSVKSLDGRVSVTINDKNLGEITGCDPAAGSISLQSEGAEIHFRRIQIRELKSETSTTAADSKPTKNDDGNDESS